MLLSLHHPPRLLFVLMSFSFLLSADQFLGPSEAVVIESLAAIPRSKQGQQCSKNNQPTSVITACSPSRLADSYVPYHLTSTSSIRNFFTDDSVHDDQPNVSLPFASCTAWSGDAQHTRTDHTDQWCPLTSAATHGCLLILRC